jgi:hypothetical protein
MRSDAESREGNEPTSSQKNRNGRKHAGADKRISAATEMVLVGREQGKTSVDIYMKV